MTTTLFNIIRSELQKKGYNEFVDKEGNLVLFEKDHQFMTKILKYEPEVQQIVDELFAGASLENTEHDTHFKKGFIYRFINRRINRQTVEAFQMELLSTFLSYEEGIQQMYEQAERYLTGSSTSESNNKQINKQKNDSTNTSDNRSAYADLPQNNVQIDVDNTVMSSASDNTISRNKQRNTQETDGETSGETFAESKTYNIDELLKGSGMLEHFYNIFDVKCFLQVW